MKYRNFKLGVILVIWGVLGLGLLSPATAGVASPPAPQNKAKKSKYQVFAWNDLGMHCYDKDFSVFSLLPPFNVVHSQVIHRAKKPKILDNTQAQVFYAAQADAQGSINRTSVGKTNFWDFISALFGVSRPLDMGILGACMPGTSNTPQPLGFDANYKWFSATGIPLTNLDDNQQTNCFPLMNIQASDQVRGRLRSSLDIVVPASSEMNCASCHETAAYADGVNTFSDASPPPRIGPDGSGLLTEESFSRNSDPQIRFRENILILHDALSGTNLWSQYNPGAGQTGQPILCAQCHYSKALDLAGNNQPTGDQVGHLYLSRAIHKHHGTAWDTGGGMGGGVYTVPIPGEGVTQCYYCHPGNDTQCLRSVMAGVVDDQGNHLIQCQSCHGNLLAVAGFTPDLGVGGIVDPNADPATLVVNLTTTGAQRRPWMDMPKCQSCHTGDALSHLGPNLVGLQAYDSADPAATPFTAVNPRFAETPGQIYRFSQTHGGIACEACHGSPHAEWPARDPNSNDNLAAKQIQGYPGKIMECGPCHGRGLPPGLKGPHGLHNVNDPKWMWAHGSFYKKDGTACQACHGLDLKGTVLSKTGADRNLKNYGGKISVAGGTQIGCVLCHGQKYAGKQ